MLLRDAGRFVLVTAITIPLPTPARILLLATLAPPSCRPAPGPRDEATSVSESVGEHYQHLLGQRYRTKVDLYLFAFRDELDRPFLGINDASFPSRPPALPLELDKELIGQTFGDARILDVVPAGAELTLISETHEVTAVSGIRDKGGYPMGFICRLTYQGRTVEGVLAEFIQASEVAPPRTTNQRIDERLAVRVAE